MKKSISLIIVLLIFTSFTPALAELRTVELRTFVKEYSYQASEDDSRNSSRTIALREVKRLLLEELGTYLESETQVNNFQLTKDKITTLTAGIVKTEIVDEQWDGCIFLLKAKIVVDPDQVMKSIDVLRNDRAKTKQLEEVKLRSDELLRENAQLRKNLKMESGKKRKKNEVAYNKTIRGLAAIEWFENGFVQGTLDNYSDAIDSFSKAIELDSKFAMAYAYRGWMYTAQRDYDEALRDCNMSIALAPKETMSYFWRGSVYTMLGNNKQAIKDFDKAIKLSSLNVMAYHFRGCAYNELGNYDQALMNFNTAIELNPEFPQPYAVRGDVYFKLDKFDQAIGDYSKAIDLDPKMTMIYFKRGSAYGKNNNIDLALQDMKIGAQLGDPRAQYVLKGMGLSW